jgi:phospholipid transport system substrate-binding protein
MTRELCHEKSVLPVRTHRPAVLALAAQALAAPPPKERVQETVDAVLEVLRDETRDVETKKRDIRVLVRQRFDFRAMAQSTLAQNWRSASEAEQDRFVSLYSRLLEDTYLVMVEEYTNETVEYRNEILRNEKNAQVDTAILAADKEIPVSIPHPPEGWRLVYL